VISAIKRADPALVNQFLLHAIAWVLIAVAAVMVAKPLLVQLAHRRGIGDWRGDAQVMGERHPWILPMVGAVVGFLVGLTSVGSGTLIIVSLLFLYPRWQSSDVVGTDVFHASMLVSAASIAQFAAGNVNVPMALSLLLGSVPGVLLGSRLAIGFPEQLLRLSLAGAAGVGRQTTVAAHGRTVPPQPLSQRFMSGQFGEGAPAPLRRPATIDRRSTVESVFRPVTGRAARQRRSWAVPPCCFSTALAKWGGLVETPTVCCPAPLLGGRLDPCTCDHRTAQVSRVSGRRWSCVPVRDLRPARCGGMVLPWTGRRRRLRAAPPTRRSEDRFYALRWELCGVKLSIHEPSGEGY
jgi:hypothetical protein